MTTLHEPVLLDEVVSFLQPQPGRVILDLTLGGGGYSTALLEQGATVHGFDRDAQAIALCRSRLSSFGERFVAHHRDFASFGEVLDSIGLPRIDGVCMDLGLSSDQLESTRGFSFRHEGELDLRFDTASGVPAWQRLESATADEVGSWLREYGEVRRARAVARAMHDRAMAGALRTTTQLRETVLEVIGRRTKPEPELARVFQALRIVVNDELGQLRSVLNEVPNRLEVGGRLAVVSYHSLEDREVKSMLRRESGYEAGTRHLPPASNAVPRMTILTRRAIQADPDEVRRNPRARSARLRAGERNP